MRRLKAGAETTAFREKIIVAQGYKCALCKGDFREAKLQKKKLVPKLRATLDHNHYNGSVRGVLCNNCNGREGEIANRVRRASRDLTDIDWLQNLVNYWATHETASSSLIYHSHKTTDEKRVLKNKRARQKRAAIKAAKLIG